MAFTADSYDNATWTRCYENTSQGLTPLPWAFLRLGDVGEERKYVVPLNGAAFIAANGSLAMRYQEAEFMPNQPFPLDSAKPLRTSGTTDADRGGPVAVHFFGRA